MSDKNKILLENKGWNEMTSILDKELPEKKRNKRLVLWFFVASIALFGVAFLFNNNNEVTENDDNEPFAHEMNDLSDHAIPGNPKRINDDKTDESNNNPNTLLTIKGTTETISIIGSKELIKKKKLNNAPTNSIEITSVENDDKVIFVEGVSEAFTVSSSNYQDNSKVFSGVINNIESSLQHTLLEESLSSVNPRSLINIEKISDGNKIITSEEKPNIGLSVMNFPQNKSMIKPSKTRNNLYLFAGANIGLDQKGTGYQLGLGKILGNKYFDFFVEGGYAHMRYKNKESINESIAIDFTPEISSSDFNIIESTSFQNAIEQSEIYNTSLINNQNYVFFTAGVEKKITKRLMVLGGITYSRFLKIENTEVSFTSINGSFQSSLDQYNISKTSLFENGDFKKYELSSKLGIGYKVSPRFNISANYRIGLTDLIRNDSPSYSANAPSGEAESKTSYK